MMESSVKQNRLIQVFLSPTATPGPSIFEVSSDAESKLYCTCSGYKGRTTCKHTRFVKARIDSNQGTYPLEISKAATEEDAEVAKSSLEAFRHFVIRFAKIEVF
jgi:hypothetical protein